MVAYSPLTSVQQNEELDMPPTIGVNWPGSACPVKLMKIIPKWAEYTVYRCGKMYRRSLCEQLSVAPHQPLNDAEEWHKKAREWVIYAAHSMSSQR